MTKRQTAIVWPAVFFVINVCVLAPIGLVITEHIKDHRNLKDRVRIEFMESNRKTGEAKELILQNTASDEAQKVSLSNLRARVDKIERRFYESHKAHSSPAKTN